MDERKGAARNSARSTKLAMFVCMVLLQMVIVGASQAQQPVKSAMLADKPPLKSTAAPSVKSGNVVESKPAVPPARRPSEPRKKPAKVQPKAQAVVNLCGDIKEPGRGMAPAGNLLKSAGPEWSRIELIRELFAEYSQDQRRCLSADPNLPLTLYIDAHDQIPQGPDDKWEARPDNKLQNSPNVWSAFEDARPQRRDDTSQAKLFINRTTPLRFYGSRYLGTESGQSRFQKSAYPPDGSVSLEHIFDEMKKKAAGREERNQLENRLRVLEGYFKLVELVYVPRFEKVTSSDSKPCYRTYSLTLAPSRLFEESPVEPGNRAKLAAAGDLRSKKEKLERLARGQGAGDSWSERIAAERNERCADTPIASNPTEASDATQASYHKDAIDAVTITMKLSQTLGHDFWKACEEFWEEVGRQIDHLSDIPE